MSCLITSYRARTGLLLLLLVSVIHSRSLTTPRTGTFILTDLDESSCIRVPANCSLSIQEKPTKLASPPIPEVDGPRTSHLLNSGLVILQPSETTLAEVVQFLNTSPTIAASRFADQDVIAGVFHGRWRPLPWWCNALKPGRAVHKDLWEDSEVRLIHFM